MSRIFFRVIFIIFLLLSLPSAAEDLSQTADAGEGKQKKKLKVFIIMGQSNTLEMGKVKGAEGSLEHAVNQEGLYPFLIDEKGQWKVRKDVRNVQVMGSGGPGKMRIKRNDWLTVSDKKIGIELGIGHQLGEALDEPILILKSSIGNRSLGWDLLPPGSRSYEFKDPKDGKTYVYAGYGESPLRWEKESEPQAIKWSAGLQYAGDVARAKEVLQNLEKFYPGVQNYEVAGFLWWQGDKDRYNAAHAAKYEENLANLIRALRKDFKAPHAKFVCATLGQSSEEKAKGNDKLILRLNWRFQMRKSTLIFREA